MGKTNGHERILELLREHRRGRGGLRLLDVPSGGGPVVDGARALGYDVVETDLFPRPGLRGVLADACAPFPFAEACMDVVLSMEGIEHFENQTAFVRECARVLRPGGLLLLTTPNVLNLSARASSFLTGSRGIRQGFVNEVSTLRTSDGKRIYHGHAYLIDAFRLRYILRVTGLSLEALEGTSLSSTSLALAPLAVAVHLGTHLARWNSRRHDAQQGKRPLPRALEDELGALARSSALLFRKKLIVRARKAAAPSNGSASAPPRASSVR